MRLAIMIPRWGIPSEVWALRSAKALAPDVKLVVADEAPSEWEGVPGFALSPPEQLLPFAQRLRRRLQHRISPPISRPQLLRKRLETLEIDTLLIHYATFADSTREIWEGLPIRVFVRCHGYDIHTNGREDLWPHRLHHDGDHYRAKLRSLSKDASLIANSKHTRSSLLADGIPPEKISLQYFGVPTQNLRRTDSDTPLRCLYLGRMVDCKGADLVVRGFASALKGGLSARLTMAGEGPLLTTCELLAHDLGLGEKIRFLGSVTEAEASELYQQSDVFLNHHRTGPLTNREEAFGVTLIEAMSHGLPVLTGRSGGVPESVIDGKTGFLVEPGDIETYTSHLSNLGQDRSLLEQLSKNSQNHVRAHFSIEQETATLARILESQ